MKKPQGIIWIIIGSIIGALLLFPPTIPLYWTISRFGEINSNTSQTFYIKEILVFVGLPLIGAILGGILAGLISKYKISLPKFDDKLLKIFLLLLCIFVLAGVELGFLFSPVVFLGLGNTSTIASMWIFPICTGTIAMILVMIIANIALLLRFLYKSLSATLSRQ